MEDTAYIILKYDFYFYQNKIEIESNIKLWWNGYDQSRNNNNKWIFINDLFTQKWIVENYNNDLYVIIMGPRRYISHIELKSRYYDRLNVR